VGSFAVAVHAVMRGADHDDKPVMRQFAKPASDVFGMAKSTKLRRGVTNGKPDGVLKLVIVSTLQRRI
jgi:hypothetical protein